MRVIVRSAAALGVLSLALAVSASPSFAQAQKAPPAKQAPAKDAAPPPAAQQAPTFKQVALTEKQLDGVIAAQKDLDAILEKVPQQQSDKPDPKVIAQLDDVAKKNGFADYAEYNTIVDNISLVMAGFDGKTKSYVGQETVIKSQIAAVQADKKIPSKEKKQALDELNGALKNPAPAVENKGNIDLVTKYYDKLAAVMQDDE